MARVTPVQTPEFRPNSSSQAPKNGDPFAVLLDTVSAKRATAPEPRRREAQDAPRVSGGERPERPQPRQDAKPVTEKGKPASPSAKNGVKGENCVEDCAAETKDTDSSTQAEGAAVLDPTTEEGAVPVVIENSPEAALDDETASDDTPDDAALLTDADAGAETDPNTAQPLVQQPTSADAVAMSASAGPVVAEVVADPTQESAAAVAAAKPQTSAGKQSDDLARAPVDGEAAAPAEETLPDAAQAVKPEDTKQTQKPVASNHAETRDAAMAEKSEQTLQNANKPEAQAPAKEQASAKAADHASGHAENSTRQQVTPQTAPVLPEPVRAFAGSINPVNLRPANEGQGNAVQLNANAIGVEIASRAKEGMRRFDIRLDPPELGRIDVRLEVDNHGKASTRLIVERPETLDLLQRDARNLERALQSAGLQTEDGGLQFSLQDQGQNGLADAGSNERYDRRDQFLASAIEDAEQAPPAVEAYARSVLARGGVDIRI